MNDFTKEELEILLDGLGWKNDLGQHADLSLGLVKKIQSMIDNYCSHKRCGIGECNNYPEECLRCNKQCNKCGEWYKE